MDSFCTKLFKAVFIRPFMAGNHRRRSNGSRYYDCTISSRVLFLVVIAVITMFTASQEMQRSADVRLGIVMVLLSALVVCGTLGCFVICYLAHKHGLEHVVERQKADKSKLRIVFLWIFAIASGVYSSFLAGKEIECSIDNVGGFYWNSIVFYTIVSTLGLCIETIFITYFSTYQLRHSVVVHNGMFMVLAANMSVLFYIVIVKDSTISAYIEISHKLNMTSCLANNSTMSELITKSSKFLTPTCTEFCLLSSTMILEIWSPAKVHRHHNDIPYIEISAPQDSETVHLLSELTESVPGYSENGGRRSMCQIITLTVSLAIGLGHLICIAAIAQHIGNVELLQNVAESYELTWKSILIIVNLVGFVCLEYYCSSDDSPKPFKTREYVYLLSACCMVMLHICEALAGSISSGELYGKPLYTSIVSILQDYLQVVFLLHASRCRKSCANSRATLLNSVLIYIAVCNFIFWIGDSFFLSKYPSTRVLGQVKFSKGVLRFAYIVLLPMSVFFRFTSFLEYFASFKQFRS